MNVPNTPIEPRPPLIFFDGECGLCNHFVNFVLSRDRKQQFQFAPLQGETARQFIPEEDRASLDSVVLVDEAGTHRSSSAAVRVLERLGGGWFLVGKLLWIIPKPLRDLGYRGVAATRYRLFGKRETCRMPTPEEQGRMLP